MMEECITQWFYMNDGEILCIQNVDLEENRYPTDQILLTREMALELANDILKEIGDG